MKVGSIVVCIYDYENCIYTRRLKTYLGGKLYYPIKGDEIYYCVRQLDDNVIYGPSTLKPALLLEEIDNRHIIGLPVPKWMSPNDDVFGHELLFNVDCFREVLPPMSFDELFTQKEPELIGCI